MRQNDMMALREIFVRGRIVLAFNGPFSQTVIEELGAAIRGHLESQAQTGKRIGDVFAVYIEMTQNIRQYAEAAALDEAERADLNAGTVLIGADDENYTVMSGNLIRNEHVAALHEKLDAVLGLDTDGLKHAYKARLRMPLEAGAVGAGLGFLQMARKAATPMEYSVAAVGPTHSFFSLSVHI